MVDEGQGEGDVGVGVAKKKKRNHGIFLAHRSARLAQNEEVTMAPVGTS